MATQLYLLRHGPSSAPVGSFVGSTDVPLSGKGLERLSGLIPSLQEMDCWYCSPMLRTRRTVDELQRHGCQIKGIQIADGLREIDFGRWEQKTFAEITAADPDLMQVWQDYENFVFPRGEAVSDFNGRIQEMLETFMQSGHARIGVMTHGGVIRTMICLALGISVRNYLLFDVQPASLTILDLYSEGGVLKGLNL
jgi:broad specificity phosphatase PhoE